MVILHVAWLDGDKCAGVGAAVPQHVIAQQKREKTALLNLCDLQIDGVDHCFSYCSSLKIQTLPDPFDAPDLIVFHEIYRPQFLSISQQAKRSGIPYIIVPHGGLSAEAQKKKQFKKTLANQLLFNRFFDGAAVLHCLSKREKETLRVPRPSFICPNGVSLPKRKKEFSVGETLRLVYIGRLEIKIKGLDLLLQAVSENAAFLRGHQVVLDIYGPDSPKDRASLTDRIARSELADIIHLHGPVFDGEKEMALLDADCFIQTSRSEGMPMGLMEALSYGLPVIVTEGTGVAADVERFDMGFHCKTSAEGIGAALCQAVEAREQLEEKGRHARTYIENALSWEMVSQVEISEYEKILKKQSG